MNLWKNGLFRFISTLVCIFAWLAIINGDSIKWVLVPIALILTGIITQGEIRNYRSKSKDRRDSV